MISWWHDFSFLSSISSYTIYEDSKLCGQQASRETQKIRMQKYRLTPTRERCTKWTDLHSRTYQLYPCTPLRVLFAGREKITYTSHVSLQKASAERERKREDQEVQQWVGLRQTKKVKSHHAGDVTSRPCVQPNNQPGDTHGRLDERLGSCHNEEEEEPHWLVQNKKSDGYQVATQPFRNPWMSGKQHRHRAHFLRKKYRCPTNLLSSPSSLGWQTKGLMICGGRGRDEQFLHKHVRDTNMFVQQEWIMWRARIGDHASKRSS